MNPELPKDWLEEALKARAAVPAPPDFTETLMRRLEAGQSYSPLSRFWMDQGLAAGLTLAILGLSSAVDMNRLGAVLARGVQASPVVVAAVTLCASAVWLAVMADDRA